MALECGSWVKIVASTPSGDTSNKPQLRGREKRSLPALPGLKNSLPASASEHGAWLWPKITTRVLCSKLRKNASRPRGPSPSTGAWFAHFSSSV
jgi:hypothetical protein